MVSASQIAFIICALASPFAVPAFTNDTLSHAPINIHAPGLPAPPSKISKRSFPELIALSSSQPTLYYEDHISAPSPDEMELREKIDASYEEVITNERFIDKIDLSSLIEFPIGQKADLGGFRYVILIDSIEVRPTGAFMFASMLIETPYSRLYFRATEIKFNEHGGLTGDAKLLLIGDHTLYENDKTRCMIRGSRERTFVLFDCNGYKQLSIEAILEFSRQIMVPENSDGKPEDKGNVSVDFETTVTDFNDLLVKINIPKFQFVKLPDFSFQVNDAYIDFSDSRNPAAMIFPKGYQKMIGHLAGGQDLWRGVFIRSFTVTLPPQFEKNKSDTVSSIQSKEKNANSNRTFFTGANLIVDNLGLSGNISASNLIPFEEGRIGNWRFSVETLYVQVVSNEVTQAGFLGKLDIPLNDPDSPKKNNAGQDSVRITRNIFSYSAIITEGGNYLFSVSNKDSLDFNLWKASVSLRPSSYIEIRSSNGKFLPRAILHGTMKVRASLSEDDGSTINDDTDKVRLPVVEFEQLQVQTVRPFVTFGTFSLGREGDEASVGGFPIVVHEIHGSSEGDNLAMTIDLSLSLVGENAGGFGARGKFKILSHEAGKNGILAYRFAGLEFERFSVDIDKGAFRFNGALNIYKNDIIYGTGISGSVKAEFSPGIKSGASAIFGSKNGNRYWFADALFASNAGVTIFPGFAFYGFGGGAFYKMRLAEKGQGSEIGRTQSGAIYIPDANTNFGFKAIVHVGLQPGKEAFNGEAIFEMAFNNTGGLKYINFNGRGFFMATPSPTTVQALQEGCKKISKALGKHGISNLNEGGKVIRAEEVLNPSKEPQSQVWSELLINYDFDNRTLHGNLDTYFNVAGGLIKGVGTKGKAGKAVIHFAPGEWYVYIGRPEYENRFGLQVMDLATIDAYFVMGTNIPGSPPPPPNVSDILGQIDPGYMKEMNALSNGKGVGFGASFRIDTGDKTYMAFYGRFVAGLGFDVMLKNYGNATCKNGQKPGINSWYANGQAYAYFEGKIGIVVKVFRKTRKVNILEIGSAVVAQAMLPNPTWIKGTVGGKFKALGGLVKGNCRFEIEIGEKCEIIRKDESSPLETVDVLAQVTPADNSAKVDVFTVPQAVFNYEIEKEYELIGENDGVIKFKISLDEFSIRNAGVKVNSEPRWNEDKTVVALNPAEILPSEKELTLVVNTSFKEKKGGYWVVSTSDGAPLKEEHKFKFTTDKAPDHIPGHNIAYSYPTTRQFNFYKNEYPEGYITLKQGQGYLFQNNPDWRQTIRFTSPDGAQLEVPFNYLASEKEVRYKLPVDLVNGRIYDLKIVNTPKTRNNNVDANVARKEKLVASSKETEISVALREATGTIKNLQEKTLYNNYFRTSNYNSLSEKLQGLYASPGWRDPILPGVHCIGSNIGGPEPFSSEEIYGFPGVPPLVRLEADLTENKWFHSEIFPLVYDGYPLNGSISFTNRDPANLGIIPVRGVFLYQLPFDITLSQNDIGSRSVNLESAVGRFDYYIAWYAYNDYLDLSNQVANYATRSVINDRLKFLLSSSFPKIKGGAYWIKIKYHLPGRNTVTSVYRHKIINPVN